MDEDKIIVIGKVPEGFDMEEAKKQMKLIRDEKERVKELNKEIVSLFDKDINYLNNLVPFRHNVVPRKSSKVGRNEPCPCGTGKKFKKCCINN